jgi:hypothetical protein
MKIEYLADGSADCPLIRIYGDDPIPVQGLHSAILRLALGRGDTVVVQKLPGFQPVHRCALVLSTGAQEGIVQSTEGEFFWSLQSARWTLVAGLVEPFCVPAPAHSHQWLCGKEARYGLDVCRIGVVLTNNPDGSW